MKNLRTHLRLLWLVLPLALLFGPASAQETKAARPALSKYNLKKGTALGGYDPVAYFPEGGGRPTEGKKSLTRAHRGVTYRFASEANRKAFDKSPERFEPAYGGWCAYAMSKGDQVEIDPKSFLIEDGKLLVFYKGLFNDTRKKWGKEGSKKLKPKADANWKKVSGEGGGRDTTQFNLKKGLAIGGYDPVAYRSGNAKKGKRTIAASYRGVEYHFANASAKNTFLSKPETYEPQYGGWCAWAMAQGKKVPVSPNAYVSDASGTYLFYNEAKRDEWLASRKRMVKDADAHWATVAPSK